MGACPPPLPPPEEPGLKMMLISESGWDSWDVTLLPSVSPVGFTPSRPAGCHRFPNWTAVEQSLPPAWDQRDTVLSERRNVFSQILHTR